MPDEEEEENLLNLYNVTNNNKSSGANRVGSATGPTFPSSIILQPLLETEDIALSIGR